MDQHEVLHIMRHFKVIMSGHFIYTGGNHGSGYINKDAIYPHTRATSQFCQAIAEEFAIDEVEVVIAPAIGGVILSQWVAYHLSVMTNREVLGVYAEKSEDGKSFLIKRGYDKFIAGKNVLVAEDILTTGGSVKKVIEAVRAIGGKVVGVGALCNRGGVALKDISNPPKLFVLVDNSLDMWDAKDCPLCQQGVPINTDVGKGREFLARKQHA